MTPRLSVISVEKRLAGRPVLRGVSLSCAPGELLVVEAPNGAGKSTLLRVVAGVLQPDAGQVLLDGESLAGSGVAARARIGYVPEGADAPPHLSTVELVGLMAALKGVPFDAAELEPLLERLGVAAYRERPVGALSLGQRRRACLAAALVGGPSLLLLDEPSNGLDQSALPLLVTLLREHAAAGGAALLASHDRAFVTALGARRVAIVDGKVAID